MKTILLTQRNIRKHLDPKRVIGVIEAAFREYALGRTKMPPKIYLDLPKLNGDFRAMPAYIERFKSASLKWVNVHADNKKIGLPTVMAVIILSDPSTGFPLAIMDGTHITSLRTAAAGAVGAKHLARKNSSVVGLVGCGVQAVTQLKALRTLFKIKEVKVWGHEKELATRFVSEMKIKTERMEAVSDIERCVSQADIIVTTTPSRKPLVFLKWLKAGVHINAIGADAPGKEELDPNILKHAKVVIDDWEQASHSGEINVPLSRGIISKKSIYGELGDIVAGKKNGRANDTEITVFDSTGLAIQDTAVAHLMFQTAVKKKFGQKIALI